MGNINDIMTELADAVRLKSGESNKLTIAQMIEAVTGLAINDDLGYRCGQYTAAATGTAATIDHGLGCVPGAVIFIKKGSTSSPATDETTLSEILFTIMYGEDSGYSYCYCTSRRTTTSSGSTSVTSTRYWGNSNSTPSTAFGEGASAATYYVTSINANSFVTPKNLVDNAKYIWIALKDAVA